MSQCSTLFLVVWHPDQPFGVHLDLQSWILDQIFRVILFDICLSLSRVLKCWLFKVLLVKRSDKNYWHDLPWSFHLPSRQYVRWDIALSWNMFDYISGSLELCHPTTEFVYSLVLEIASPCFRIEHLYQIPVLCEDHEWFYWHQEES